MDKVAGGRGPAATGEDDRGDVALGEGEQGCQMRSDLFTHCLSYSSYVIKKTHSRVRWGKPQQRPNTGKGTGGIRDSGEAG